MPKTSIIIPNYNGCDMLRECIASIKQYTPEPYEIIVVDNGSSDGTLELCRAERVRLISSPVNRGFPAACNLGMKIAVGEAIVLLNNDTIVTPKWLDNMLACLYSSDDVGIVGPKSNFVSGRQMIEEPFTNIADMAQRMNVPDRRKWLEVQRIVGLCFLFKRQVLEQVGLMDERFTPGHFEDDDYCYRARLAGYRLMISGDVFIYHHGSASFGKEKQDAVQQLLARNRQMFIDKWGVDPHQFI